MFNSINDFLDRVETDERKYANVTVQKPQGTVDDEFEFERLVHHHSNQDYLDY